MLLDMDRRTKGTVVASALVALAMGALAGCAESRATLPDPNVPAGAQAPDPASSPPPEGEDDFAPPPPSADEAAAVAPAEGEAAELDDVAYDESVDRDPTALADFRATLDPYGTWEDDPTYGTVWVPASTVVGDDFAPYVSAGHWGYTDANEYVWVSDYDWGWAPFHYGRWVWIGGRGWAWIPGRVYAPAWVVWRTGYYDDYYVGWAPMPPTWYWYGGVSMSLWYVPPAPYVFCRSAFVFSPTPATVIMRGQGVGGIASHTRPYFPAQPGARGPYQLVRGPTPAEAHIPVGAMPGARTGHDARAIGAARPVAGGRLVAPAGAARPLASPGGPRVGRQRIGSGGAPVYDRPVARPAPGVRPGPAPAPAPAYGRPGWAGAPAPRYGAPAPMPRAGGAPSAPRYGTTPSVPHYGGAPAAPHYSGGAAAPRPPPRPSAVGGGRRR